MVVSIIDSPARADYNSTEIITYIWLGYKPLI